MAVVFLIELFAKSVLVAAIAWVAAALCRHKSAAFRHRIWFGSLVVLLALPLAQIIVPAKPIFLLRGETSVSARADAGQPNQFVATKPSATPAGGLRADRSSTEKPDAADFGDTKRSAGALTATVGSEPARNEEPPSKRTGSIQASISWVLAIWLIGALFVVVRFSAGYTKLRALYRSSRPYPLPDSVREELLARTGTQRFWELRIMTDRRIGTALTWGARRHVVLLPKEAEGWTAEFLETVLLHELAHARRLDSICQLIGDLACALYWPNALVWMASGAMRWQAERAADDCVVEAGVRPSSYAALLIHVALSIPPKSSAAPAMAVPILKHDKIEHRIEAILDPGLRRGGLSRAERAAAVLIALCLALPIAALRASEASAAPPAESGLAVGPRSIPSGVWTFVGPRHLKALVPDYEIGDAFISGAVNDAAFDPSDSNVIYAASAGGGVFKSTDAGGSWTPLSDSWPILETSAIAIDPKDHLKLYVGTGDPHYKPKMLLQPTWHDGAFRMPVSLGVMISKDGGRTWKQSAGEISKWPVTRIVVDPDDPDRITVATGSVTAQSTDGGVFQSFDGGETWSKSALPDGLWTDLSISGPGSDGKRVYWAVGSSGAYYSRGWKPYVFRSDDEGKSWTEANEPSSAGLSYQGRSFAVGASQVNPNRVTVECEHAGLTSVDGGKTWKGIYGDNSVFSVNRRVLRYLKEGSSEQFFWGFDGPAFGPGEQGGHPVDNIEWGIRSLAVNPKDAADTLICSQGGLYRYNLSTHEMRSLNENLPVSDVLSVAADGRDSNSIAAGCADADAVLPQKGSDDWHSVGFQVGYPQTHYLTAVAKDDSGVTYAFDDRQTFYAAAEGRPFSPVDIKPQGPLPAIVATADGKSLLIGGDSRVGIYSTRSKTYDEHNLPLTGRDYGTVATCPSDPKRFYAGETWNKQATPPPARVPALAMSKDGGASWGDIEAGLPEGVAIEAIDASSKDANDVLVAVLGVGADGPIHRVYRNRNVLDIASHWVDVTGPSGDSKTFLPRDVPIHAIAHNASNPETAWYLGTDVGVFETKDGGKSYTNMDSKGLPRVMVTSLRAAGGETLYAGTFGRGIWEIKLR